MYSDDPTPFPDDVPIVDAVEQLQPTADLPADEAIAGTAAPLESDPSDWQEQHQSLEDPFPDDDRR
jgi:hypothetical protein